MSGKTPVIKLTDKDKRTILQNLRICTEAHGKGCPPQNANEKNKSLN